MDRTFIDGLALARYKIADLYAEREHQDRVKEAKQARLSWFNRQTKPSEQEQVATTIEAGRNSTLRSI